MPGLRMRVKTYGSPGKAQYMSLLLELSKFETNLHDSSENLLGPFMVKEVPLLLQQDQDAVIVQLRHPIWMEVSTWNIRCSISWYVLSPDGQSRLERRAEYLLFLGELPTGSF